MRTNAIVTVLPLIAVHTQNLESRREVVLDKPTVKFGAIMRCVNLLSMLFSIIPNMVNAKKERFCFSATSTLISTVGLNNLILKAVVIGKRVLPSLIRVVLSPFRNLGNYFVAVRLMVFSAIVLQICFGLLSPFSCVLFAAILALSAILSKAEFIFFFTAGFTSPHVVIIAQYDYDSQSESVTTIPKGSTLQATGKGSARHPERMMIWSELTGDCKQPSGGLGLANSSEHIDGNQLGVAGGLIFGLKKTYFNSMNFGSMVIKTYSPSA